MDYILYKNEKFIQNYDNWCDTLTSPFLQNSSLLDYCRVTEVTFPQTCTEPLLKVVSFMLMC